MFSKKPGNSFRRKNSSAFPVELSKRKRPINLLSGTPHHTFTVNLNLEVAYTCLMRIILGPHAHFVNYLHCSDEKTPHHWIKCRLTVRDELSFSGTNPYAERGRLVPDVPPDHGKDTNLPHVKFAIPAYVICRRERPFYVWTDADFCEPSEECSLVC